MKESFSIRFYLNHAKSRDGKAQIYARIIVNREKVEVSTKLFVKSDLWNEDAGRTTKSSSINDELSDVADCRAYIENPDDLLSKPAKCSYNPYVGE